MNSSSRNQLNDFWRRAASPLDPRSPGASTTTSPLLLRWNARVNLTAIRDEEGIFPRHFVESIAMCPVPANRIATLLDSAPAQASPESHRALPPEIAVTLAESQGKKAAVLSEAVPRTGSPQQSIPAVRRN